MVLQRARVPASRDVAERLEAERTLATVRRMDVAGELPPKPEEKFSVPELIATSLFIVRMPAPTFKIAS